MWQGFECDQEFFSPRLRSSKAEETEDLQEFQPREPQAAASLGLGAVSLHSVS